MVIKIFFDSGFCNSLIKFLNRFKFLENFYHVPSVQIFMRQ